MPTYKITFELHSAVRTPFHADSLFGHLAWAIRYTQSEERLKQWLGSYADSPTLLSDAFPLGYVPKPIVSPLSNIEREKLKQEMLEQKLVQTPLEFFEKLKSVQKVRLLTSEMFERIQNNLSSIALFRELLKETQVLPPSEVELVSHNTINRMTSSVLAGSLFQFEETFYQPGTVFFFYLQTETINLTELRLALTFIEQSGYGADKSTGKGALKIEEIQPTSINHAVNANAFVTLSSFIPTPNCSTVCTYELFTKFGKLGGEYAIGGNPFKKPLLMMKTGSTFRSSPNGVYGLLMADVHTDPAIRHYAYAFPVGVRLREGEVG